VKNILAKFKNVFSVDIKIESEDLNTIFLFSRIRNVLSHNNGVVNEIFLSELKQENINTNYKLDQKIKIDSDKHIGGFQDLIHKLTGSISDQIIAKIKHFEEYSRSL
jgi:hypothetical protein